MTKTRDGSRLTMKHHRRKGVDLAQMDDSPQFRDTSHLQGTVLYWLVVHEQDEPTNEIRVDLSWIRG